MNRPGLCLVQSMTQAAVDDGTDASSALVAPVTSYTWNALGQLLTRTDPTGRQVRNAYNTQNYLSVVTVENGAADIVTSFARNSAGDIVSVTDPLSRVHTGTYDASRRLTRYDGPAGTGAASEWRYNGDGLVDRIRQATGLAAPAPPWAETTYVYYDTGRVARMTDPDGYITQYNYDALNRPDCVAVRMNPAVYASEITNATPISACAHSTQGPAGPDRIARTLYDAEGQVLQELRGVGSPEAIVYATRTWTPNGALAWVEDANDNRSDLTYDGFDRLDRLSFPSPTTDHVVNVADYEAYGYDPNGNRVSLRLRSGETIGYHYDALNRECFKDLPSLVADPSNECSHDIADAAGGDVFSGYDLGGRRVYARFPGSFAYDVNCNTAYVGVDYCYDTVGRLQYETSYGRRLTFAYDAASNRTRVTHPDGVYFQYSYDALNRVDQVQLNGSAAGLSLIGDYAYDAQSRRISLARGNGAATTYGYTDASRLASLVHNLEGATTANDANWSFGYNAAGQVISRTLVQVYERTVPALSESYARNGLNQYTNVGGVAFAYTGDDGARGNLTSDGARNFDYDVENRLVAVSGAASGSLSYDPLGRLRSYTTGGTTTEFLYDGDRLVAEYVGGTLARRYAHGPGVDEPLIWYEGSGTTDPRWLIADRQGSIIATTNASGAAATYGYDPYGIPREWTGAGGAMLSRFRYTGQAALPELQLYHYKARVYDPVRGRFLQTDPVGYEANLNLYMYVANDPVNGSDPSGRCPAGNLLCGAFWSGEGPETIENMIAPPGTYTVTLQGVVVKSFGSLALIPPRPVGSGLGASVEGGLYYHNEPAGQPDSAGLIGEFSPLRVGSEFGASLNLGYSPGSPSDGPDYTATFSGGPLTGTVDLRNTEAGIESVDMEIRSFGGGDRVGWSAGRIYRGTVQLWGAITDSSARPGSRVAPPHRRPVSLGG